MEYKFDYILDVVEGINEIKIFDNLKILNPHRMFSLHDFDLTFFLGLMERLGKVDNVKIIGIPIQTKSNANEIANQLLEKGFLVEVIASGYILDSGAIIRLMVNSAHKNKHITDFIKVFSDIYSKI